MGMRFIPRRLSSPRLAPREKFRNSSAGWKPEVHRYGRPKRPFEVLKFLFEPAAWRLSILPRNQVAKMPKGVVRDYKINIAHAYPPGFARNRRCSIADRRRQKIQAARFAPCLRRNCATSRPSAAAARYSAASSKRTNTGTRPRLPVAPPTCVDQGRNPPRRRSPAGDAAYATSEWPCNRWAHRRSR